jgi:hypothetical protein
MNQSTEPKSVFEEEAERLEREEGLKVEEKTKTEKVVEKKEDEKRKIAADDMAKGLVNGLAFTVKTLFGVEYDESTKSEGIKTLTPCFQSDAVPDWAVDSAAKWGKWFGAVFFVGMTGYGTYVLVKAQKEANAKKQPSQVDPVEEPSYQATAAVENTGSSFATVGE